MLHSELEIALVSGVSAGWTDIPNGPRLRGDVINFDAGAIKAGTGINYCRFSLD